MIFFPTPVLVGVDGDAASHHALLAAAELCRATGSPLHLVHVALTSGTLRGRPMTPAQREHADDESRRLLEREAGAAGEVGVEVDGTHLRYAERLDTGFVEVQEQLGAGLLVIGDGVTGTQASRLMQAGGGAGPAGTVRRSGASVLVVRERAGMAPSI